MAEGSPVKNVAIVGASGNLGAPTLRALIEANRFNITILTRTNSNPSFPTGPNIRIEAGDYGSSSFLESALRGQDALILTLGHMIPRNLNSRLVEAAAAADVEWIFPTEFGSDCANENLVEFLPPMMMKAKKGARDQIEKLGRESGGRGPKWIGLITNPWIDFSLPRNLFSVSAPDRTATLYSGGTAKLNTTTLAQAGLAISRLLSLSPAALSAHANRFVYVSSFLVSQQDILAAAQRVTNTKPEEWKIEHKDLEEDIRESQDMLAGGDMRGLRGLFFGALSREGFGGDYQSTKGLANGELGLKGEDLDEVVRGCLGEWGTVNMGP